MRLCLGEIRQPLNRIRQVAKYGASGPYALLAHDDYMYHAPSGPAAAVPLSPPPGVPARPEPQRVAGALRPPEHYECNRAKLACSQV